MQTYSEHIPTAFDSHIQLDAREDWLVAPVSRDRDTASALELSNWKVQLKALGGESDTVEVHRFRHWGHGWYEIVLVAPARRSEVSDLYQSLKDYSVLDDDDYSQTEYDEAYEGFLRYGSSDLLEALEVEWEDLPFDASTMWDVYCIASKYTSWMTEDSNDGVLLNIEEAAEAIINGPARDYLTKLIIDHSRTGK